ncbi:MAG: TonB-dependent receptor [Flavobacteriaceae bacterium]|nr:TonB-dependent receptor [Flavobacteriaceae bacterium]
MKTKNKLFKGLLTMLILSANLILAQTTITGKVVDSENQEAIPGANIIVVGSNTGTVADFDGNFTLNTSAELPLTIEISYIGFGSQTVEVTSVDQSISVELSFGQNLNEVVISASRRSEKILDAPASVSIITSQDLENTANVTDPVRNLINIPGIQFQQQSANSVNFEMRAGSGVFGTSVFPILDYRFLQSPASGSFFAFQSGLSNLDLDRVEIVRGAASALYGPGVESGVVHFFSKKAIDNPGTSLELIGGNLSTRQVAIRHATANKKKTFGFKINAQYKSGNEFELDPVEDAALLSQINTSTANGIFQPTVRNNRIDPSVASNQVLTRDEIDPDGDGNAYMSEYESFMANAHLEFRPNDNTDAVISGGINSGNGLIFQGQGPGYAAGNDYWGQARIRSGGFFGQVTYNANDGGSENSPFYLYLTAQRIITKRSALDAQLQYSFDAANFLDSNFTFGVDYRDIGADSENTLFGQYDGNNDYNNYGIYGQGTSRFSEKLDLTYALRYDKLNYIDEGKIAPRIALVFKPNSKNSFRLTYNQAIFGPTSLETFLDFPVNIPAPGVVDVWASGQISAQNFDANAPIEIVGGGGATLPADTTNWPLAVPYGAVAGLTLPPLFAGVAASPSYAPLLPLIQNFFSTYVPGGAAGTIEGYNIANGSPMPTAIGSRSAILGTTTSWELGYKGLLGDKFAVGLDVYTFARSGSTQFTAVGPTFRLNGAEAIPAALGAQVASDFASDPLISAAITQAVTAGVNAQVQAGVEAQYTASGIPEAIWATGAPAGALFPGSPEVAPVSAAVAATAAPLIAPAIAAANQEVAGLVGGAFIQGGQGYLAAINPGVIGAIESQRVPQGDGITHISYGYRIFDNSTRSHVGADLSLEYFASDKLTLWGNSSWLSQNEWNPGEANDDDLPFQDFLNAPRFKFRLGMDYMVRDGFQFSLAFQHDDEFNSNQGFYAGTVQEKNLVDANIGFKLTDAVKLDLSSTNLFNQQYRAFPNMPVIGRRVNLRATFNL